MNDLRTVPGAVAYVLLGKPSNHIPTHQWCYTLLVNTIQQQCSCTPQPGQAMPDAPSCCNITHLAHISWTCNFFGSSAVGNATVLTAQVYRVHQPTGCAWAQTEPTPTQPRCSPGPLGSKVAPSTLNPRLQPHKHCSHPYAMHHHHSHTGF
jgi:hypothetical protein